MSKWKTYRASFPTPVKPGEPDFGHPITVRIEARDRGHATSMIKSQYGLGDLVNVQLTEVRDAPSGPPPIPSQGATSPPPLASQQTGEPFRFSHIVIGMNLIVIFVAVCWVQNAVWPIVGNSDKEAGLVWFFILVINTIILSIICVKIPPLKWIIFLVGLLWILFVD